MNPQLRRRTASAALIVGFFVAAIGTGLIFHGVTEAIRDYLLAATH